MNFKDLLEANIIDEWKDNYINFDRLSNTLNNILALEVVNVEKAKKRCCCAKQRKDVNREGRAISNHAPNIEYILQVRQHSHFVEERGDDDDDSKQQNDYFYKDNMHFLSLINSESSKVNEFYVSIEKQLYDEYELICDRLNQLNDGNSDEKEIEFQEKFQCLQRKSVANASWLEPLNLPKKSVRDKSREVYMKHMKRNIFVLYQRFIVLSNFSILNHIGFEIIINKYNNDKIIGMLEIEKLDFIKSRKCRECMNGLIVIYSKVFESGDMDRGKVRLLHSISWNNTKSRLLNNEKSIFWMGMKFGMMCGLILQAMLDLFTTYDELADLKLNVIYIYRCCGVLLTLLWFWTFLIYIWSQRRINYVFIFQLNPRNRLSFLQYFDIAIILTIVYFLNIILFIDTFRKFGIKYANILPSALFIFFILKLIIPLFPNWSSRKMILNNLKECIIAPFGIVGFREFYTGDVLCSLSKHLVDVYLSGCILLFNEWLTDEADSVCLESQVTKIIRPILICSPYWFRFMQCVNRYYVTGKRLPNGFNALKYGLSLSVTLMGLFQTNMNATDDLFEFNLKRVIWLSLTLFCTGYLLFWDIVMDWNLLPWDKRTKLYPKWWYLMAVIIDCIFRFFWTFTLFPDKTNPYFNIKAKGLKINMAVFALFIEIAEIFRRAMWSIFRIEKAHIGQKEEFQSYQYIPLFFENNTLINEKQKKSKPLYMKMESILFIILIIAAIVVVNLYEFIYAKKL